MNWLLDPLWILSLGLHAFFTSLGVGLCKIKTPKDPSLIPLFVLKKKNWALAPFLFGPQMPVTMGCETVLSDRCLPGALRCLGIWNFGLHKLLLLHALLILNSESMNPYTIHP
jgi:hypothetical protein